MLHSFLSSQGPRQAQDQPQPQTLSPQQQISQHARALCILAAGVCDWALAAPVSDTQVAVDHSELKIQAFMVAQGLIR